MAEIVSKVGDYVHRFEINYAKYGITKNSENSFDLDNALKEQKEKINNQIKLGKANKKRIRECEKVEEFLNDFFYSKKSFNDKNNEYMQEFNRRLNLVLDSPVYNVKIDPKDGFRLVKKNLNLIKASQSNITIGRLTNILNTLNRVNLKKSQNNKKNKELLLSVIARLEDFLESVKNSGEFKDSSMIKISALEENLIKDINTILPLIALPRNYTMGLAQEAAIALLSVQAENLAFTNADEIIESCEKLKENIWVSKKSSRLEIDKSKFSKDIDIDSLIDGTEWRTSDENGNIIQMKCPTEDKTDVIFQLNEKFDKLKISAKNYFLQEGSDQTISIVFQTTLWNLIINEDATFINHWLNIVGTNEKKNYIQSSLYDKAHLITKLSLFLSGLIGTKGEISDTLILNSRSQKHYYVRDMGSILNSAKKAVDKIYIEGYPTDLSSYNDITKENGPRIRDLLRSLHFMKMSINIDREIVYKSKNQ